MTRGGAQMSISYDVTATLREQMKHHEPIVLAYESHATDARYNPMGETCCTLGARLGTGGGNVPLIVEYETVQQSKE